MVCVALATIRAETEGFIPISEYVSSLNSTANADPFNLYDPGTKIGEELGNVQPGDGARFCGRGFVQLTGPQQLYPDRERNSHQPVGFAGAGQRPGDGRKNSGAIPLRPPRTRSEPRWRQNNLACGSKGGERRLEWPSPFRDCVSNRTGRHPSLAPYVGERGAYGLHLSAVLFRHWRHRLFCFALGAPFLEKIRPARGLRPPGRLTQGDRTRGSGRAMLPASSWSLWSLPLLSGS